MQVAGRLWSRHRSGCVIGYAWVALLSATTTGPALRPAFGRVQPLLFSLGGRVFLLSSAVHYLLVAVDQSRAAETRALRHQMLAPQAELRALRAQITPHFLFNSLNSISALTSTDPAGARRMCMLLGDFLRGTLQIGQPRPHSAADRSWRSSISSWPSSRSASAIGCASSATIEHDTLAVPRAAAHPAAARRERVRPRPRPAASTAGRADRAACVKARLVLTIDNPSNRRPAEAGSGTRPENVRRRIEAVYGTRASITAGRPGRPLFASRSRFHSAREGAARMTTAFSCSASSSSTMRRSPDRSCAST